MAEFGLLVFFLLLLSVIGISVGLWLTAIANRAAGGESASWKRKVAAGFVMVVPLIVLVALVPSKNFPQHVIDQLDDQNDLRQLALGMINYDSAHRDFPAITRPPGAGDEVAGGLSWRVHLLPYLGLTKLHKRFHVDEPWDSPHNRSLIESMPDEYKSDWPTAKVPVGYTLYQRPVGDGAIANFKGAVVGYDDIVDGSSNTILIVQVDPSAAVPWTQPVDYEIPTDTPLCKLGHIRSQGVFLVAMADGSVRRFDLAGVPNRIVHAFFTYAGGEAIPESVIEGSR